MGLRILGILPRSVKADLYCYLISPHLFDYPFVQMKSVIKVFLELCSQPTPNVSGSPHPPPRVSLF